MALITFEEALGSLRIELDHDGGSPPIYDDERVPDISNKIIQAEAIVLNYLKREEADLYASPPSFTERDIECIRAAVFVALSALYDDERDLKDIMVGPGEARAASTIGTIPLLLARLRDPVLR